MQGPSRGQGVVNFSATWVPLGIVPRSLSSLVRWESLGNGLGVEC